LKEAQSYLEDPAGFDERNRTLEDKLDDYFYSQVNITVHLPLRGQEDQDQFKAPPCGIAGGESDVATAATTIATHGIRSAEESGCADIA
jgi:hypothetical protein